MADNIISRSQITLLAVPNLSITISPETILIPINADGYPIENNGVVIDKFSKQVEIKVYEGDKLLKGNEDGVSVFIEELQLNDINQADGLSTGIFYYNFSKEADEIKALLRTGKITVTASYGVTTITKDFYWVKNEPGATGPMGNGISSVKEFFLATELNKKPEIDDNWQEDINDTDFGESKPYLWKFERTFYTQLDYNPTDSSVILLSTHADGIKESNIEYAISETNIQPTEGWSKIYPSEIPPGYYLWTRTTTEYLLGDTSIAYSVSRIGIDAESLYTWIKYSNSPEGEEMSDSPTYQDLEGNILYYDYIGVAYNQDKEEESNIPID